MANSKIPDEVVLGKMLPGAVDKKTFVDMQFRRALDATARKRNRLYTNLSYYFGDQIPDAIKSKLDNENRDVYIYNIAQRKVQGLVGSLMQNNFNITYMAIDGSNTSLIHSLQDMLLADQNMGNWDYQFLEYIKYGLIEEAIMELSTSTAASALGNLQFSLCQPGSVIVDPNWRTSNSSDMQECFKYTYLSPSQLIDLFPDMEDQIKAAIFERIRVGRNYEERNQNFNQDYQTMLGSDFMVLQYYYLEARKSRKELDIKTGKELPDTEDVEYKKRWLEINQIDVDYVREVRYTKKICNVITTIPGLLSVPVQDRLHELQIERIPLFPWACERINGETRSIMDVIKPLQDTLNKRENMLNNILENSANGSAAVDPSIVDNDPTKMKQIQENWSNPRFKFWTVPGALLAGKNYFLELPHSVPPNEIFNQITHLWESIDRVLPINAAADGRSENRGESGILYSMKERAIEIAQQTLVQGIMSTLSEMGDAYYKAARSYYSNVERVFVKPDGSNFKINEIIALPSGDVGIRNDVSSLQPLKTLVKMGQNSPNVKFSRRLTALDLLRLIPQNFQSLQVEVMAELIDTLDLDDDYKAKLAVAVENTRVLAAGNEAAQFATANANKAQAEANTKNIQNPPQQPGLPGQGGQLQLPDPGQGQGQQQPEQTPQEQGNAALMAKLAPLIARNG